MRFDIQITFGYKYAVFTDQNSDVSDPGKGQLTRTYL